MNGNRCVALVVVRKLCLLVTIFLAVARHVTITHAAVLAPHRAAYQVQLVEPRGQITSAAGLMVVENARVCEGWSIIATLRMRFQLADGTTAETEVTFSSVESRTLYRFSSVVFTSSITNRSISRDV